MQYRRSNTKGATYFFTIVTYMRKKILCDEANIVVIDDAFRSIINKRPFEIDAFVILPDHIHCIWTLPENDNDFSIRWRLFKNHVTRRFSGEYKESQTASRLKKGEQTIWQRRFWEHRIRDQHDFNRHVEYIHYNPVKHGLVSTPEEWPYSSFHRYVEQGIYDRNWGADNIQFDESIGGE